VNMVVLLTPQKEIRMPSQFRPITNIKFYPFPTPLYTQYAMLPHNPEIV